MKFLDWYIDLNIRTMQDGRRIYRPYGVFGSGRVIPNGQEEARLRSRLRPMFAAILVASILFGTVFNVVGFGLALISIWAALAAVGYVWNERVVRQTSAWQKI